MSETGTQSTVEVNRRPIALMGTFPRTLDPKKRLTIPSVWRAALGPEFAYVLPDVKRGCLRLIPRDTMEARLAELTAKAAKDPRWREALERVAAAGEPVEFDVQGRIRIKDPLLAFAKLSGPVELRGSFDMATIWPREEAKKPVADQLGDVDKLGEAMDMLGFGF